MFNYHPYVHLFFQLLRQGVCGIYDTQCVDLLASKQHRAMEELWTQERNSETDAKCGVTVQCICCKTYDNWKSRHPNENKLLRECIATQDGYEFFPDEKVIILEKGHSSGTHGNHPLHRLYG